MWCTYTSRTLLLYFYPTLAHKWKQSTCCCPSSLHCSQDTYVLVSPMGNSFSELTSPSVSFSCSCQNYSGALQKLFHWETSCLSDKREDKTFSPIKTGLLAQSCIFSVERISPTRPNSPLKVNQAALNSHTLMDISSLNEPDCFFNKDPLIVPWEISSNATKCLISQC